MGGRSVPPVVLGDTNVRHLRLAEEAAGLVWPARDGGQPVRNGLLGLLQGTPSWASLVR